MNETLNIDGIAVEVVRKHIKNIYLRVQPSGAVRISAPARMPAEAVQAFAASRTKWIHRQRERLRGRRVRAPRRYVDLETHHVWGRPFLLTVDENGRTARVELKDDRLALRVRPGTDRDGRRAVLESWYRRQLREAAAPLFDRWEPVLGVKVGRLFVQRMKTRWGSCNYRDGNIRLNTELARRPPECLEYIIVHEMLHLLEPSHNARFQSLMDRFLPAWRLYRERLDRTGAGTCLTD